MKKIIYLLGGVILLFSCRKSDHNELTKSFDLQNINSNIPFQDGQMTVLGDTIPNPYTIQNMLEAKQLLDSLNIQSPNPVNIRITHYYVKFSPSNEDQLSDLMEGDTSIVFHVTPILQEIAIQGSFYKEPNLPIDVPTPHYAAVPVDFDFNPNIAYSILSELYLPDEDPDLIGNDPNDSYSYIEALVYAAGIKVGIGGMAHELYNPMTWDLNAPPIGFGHLGTNGTINIYDTRLATNIGLENVKVECSRFFSSRVGRTAYDGTYTLSGTPFSGTKKFSISLDNEKFIIKDNVLEKYTISRTGISSNNWNHTITLGYDNMAGQMYRAANLYCNGIVPFKRPFPGVKIALIARNYNIGPDKIGFFNLLKERIEISRYLNAENTIALTSDQYFATTIHELAHVSHYNIIYSAYGNTIRFVETDNFIKESWAVGVENYLTKQEYRARGILNYGSESYTAANLPNSIEYNYQYWNPTDYSATYTNLFINLFDNYNEIGQAFYGKSNGYVNDNITGYDIFNIEQNVLPIVKTKAELKSQLHLYKPSSVTTANLNTLLSHY